MALKLWSKTLSCVRFVDAPGYGVSFSKAKRPMSAANPLPREIRAADSRPQDPSMEEILASIRRIIADDQEVPAAQAQNGAVSENAASPAPAPQTLGEEEPLVSPKTNSSVNSAFNALVASRFVQHSDAIMALTHEMLRPMLKAWLDEHLGDLVERLVKEEIERLSQG